jgi:hypothetical protein
MIRTFKASLVCATVLFMAEAICASTIDSEPKAYVDSEPRDGEYDPGVIPNSAVETSDNCTRIADLEEQLERGFTPQQFQRIQGPEQDLPLGVYGKFRLALANISDPFAIVTTAMDSEMGNAAGGKSTLPRGVDGFGERFGIAMAGQASSEFFSTFLFSSIFHQDPHYHRDPEAHVRSRVVHALSFVLVTRSDSGKPMFNFAEFLGTASSSLVEGGLHPEWARDPGATSGRIFVSIGSDAAWNLMTEFLPDVAKHLNPRLMLLRRLADKAAEQN